MRFPVQISKQSFLVLFLSDHGTLDNKGDWQVEVGFGLVDLWWDFPSECFSLVIILRNVFYGQRKGTFGMSWTKKEEEEKGQYTLQEKTGDNKLQY